MRLMPKLLHLTMNLILGVFFGSKLINFYLHISIGKKCNKCYFTLLGPTRRKWKLPGCL